MSRAMLDVAAERERQIEVEGFGDVHDDRDHNAGDLTLAAAAYACFTARDLAKEDNRDAFMSVATRVPANIWQRFWPFDRASWKPKDARRNLVRAAALLIAEIDKIDRKERRGIVPAAEVFATLGHSPSALTDMRIPASQFGAEAIERARIEMVEALDIPEFLRDPQPGPVKPLDQGSAAMTESLPAAAQLPPLGRNMTQGEHAAQLPAQAIWQRFVGPSSYQSMETYAWILRLIGKAIDTERAKLALQAGGGIPIDIVLFCPVCGKQHIDAPEPATGWTNPPHRSHQCHNCGAVWRPADVATNGVAQTQTVGAGDNFRSHSGWAERADGAWMMEMPAEGFITLVPTGPRK